MGVGLLGDLTDDLLGNFGPVLADILGTGLVIDLGPGLMGGLGAELVGNLGIGQRASLGVACTGDIAAELIGIEPETDFDVSPSESELADDTETGLKRALTIDRVGESSLVGDLATTRRGTRLVVSTAVFPDSSISALNGLTLASPLPSASVLEQSEGFLSDGSGEFVGLCSSADGRAGMDSFREAGRGAASLCSHT